MKKLNEHQLGNLRASIWALKKNDKKAKFQMRDDDGGRCCLCVMHDVAVARGARPFEQTFAPSQSQFEYEFGFSFHTDHIGGHTLDVHNDGTKAPELTHKEIAALLEEEFADQLNEA